jgi:hypothetical protein
MKRISIAVFHLYALGCDSRESDPNALDRDGGSRTDGGAIDPSRDGGATGLDAGSELDAGSRDAAMPHDAYVHDPGEAVCPVRPYTAFGGLYCSVRVAACLDECEPGCTLRTIETECLGYEVSPDSCYGCIFSNAMACATTNGCQRSWDLYLCCAERECAGVADVESCVAEFCPAELDAFSTCLPARVAEGTCALRDMPCFL